LGLIAVEGSRSNFLNKTMRFETGDELITFCPRKYVQCRAEVIMTSEMDLITKKFYDSPPARKETPLVNCSIGLVVSNLVPYQGPRPSLPPYRCRRESK
jgi:hypothetical protein